MHSSAEYLRERLEDPNLSPEYKSLLEETLGNMKTFHSFFLGERVKRINRQGSVGSAVHEVMDHDDEDFQREFQRQHGESWRNYVGPSGQWVAVKCVQTTRAVSTRVGHLQPVQATRLVRASE